MIAYHSEEEKKKTQQNHKHHPSRIRIQNVQ